MNTVERLYDLEDSETDSLFAAKVGEQTIEVKEYENLRWLTIDGEAIQSIVDIEAPSALMNPVTQIMLSICYFSKKLDSILNLGMGGGSIERFFNSNLPTTTLTSVESEEVIIYVAHEYFFIPNSSIVHCIDANEFINKSSNEFDLILCDMFVEEFHPEFLYTEAFYSNIQNNLSKEGILSINLIPEDESDLLEILLPLRKYFTHTYLYELDEHYNIILFASNQPLDLDIQSQHEQSLTQSCQLLDKSKFFNRLQTLPINKNTPTI